MNTVTPSSRHFIPILLEKSPESVAVIAYCPICNQVEKTVDDERGEHRATAASLAKIHAHMKTRHRMTAK